MQLIVVPQESFPIAHLSLNFRLGPADVVPAQPGLVALTHRLLQCGTLRRSRSALEEAVESLGTELGLSTQRGVVRVSASVLQRHLPKLVELFAEVLCEPALEAEEFERVRRQMIAQQEALLDDDSQLAGLALRRLLYGAHAFALGNQGSPASLRALTLEQVRAQAQRSYQRERLVVGASGAVQADALRQLLGAQLAPLRAGAPVDERGLSLPEAPAGRQVWLIDKPQRSQSQILLAQPTPHAAHADWPALSIALMGFGGTFSSRLMQEVRVKRGLSYGADARLSADRWSGYALLSAAPEAQDTLDTFALLHQEYARFIEEGLSDAEIAFARDAALRSFSFALETPASRVAQMLRAQLLGWPEDVLRWWPETLKALRPEQVRAAARAYLSADDLVAAVVCSADTLQERFEALEGWTVRRSPYTTLLES